MTRWTIGAAGAALGLFGLFRLVTEIPVLDLLMLGVWLIGALVLHDGMLAPLTSAVAGAIVRYVPSRLRRYVQGALVTGAIVTVIALPLILLAGSQPPEKALLRQNFGANLAVLLGVISGGTAVLYLLRVARDRRAAERTSEANVRPSRSHTSSTS